MSSSKQKIILEVTEDQRDMLEGFYTACGWTFNPQSYTGNQNGKCDKVLFYKSFFKTAKLIINLIVLLLREIVVIFMTQKMSKYKFESAVNFR